MAAGGVRRKEVERVSLINEFAAALARMQLPELEPHCGSWIATSPTGHAVELFERANAQRALNAGWKVETAAQYLGRINREIRERA
jgi:hypothetical protein